MKKRFRLFNLALAMSLIIASISPVYALEKPKKVDEPDKKITVVIEIIDDTKAQMVEQVKEEIATRELTIEERISITCEKYGISDEIPLAIAKLETGHFKSNAYIHYNNPGGMSINEVPIKYDTIDEGVEAFIKNLANNYFAQGLTTPETISRKYCPVNAENWAKVARQLM